MQLLKEVTKDKLRGGFYTPTNVASFILNWAFDGADESVSILEPSCGDGVFLEAIQNGSYKYDCVTAIELDAQEYQKASSKANSCSKMINGDFHEYCNTTNEKFDLVVGNPPYIRYQYFDQKQQDEAKRIYDSVDIPYTKLSNAWVSFVVGSSLLLKEKGKIGFVVPAELLQVKYATPLRKFLVEFYSTVTIISFETLIFPGVQQEVVLLLCEKGNTDECSIHHIEVEDGDALTTLDLSTLKSGRKQVDFTANKWTYYFLEQEEITFLSSIAKRYNIHELSHFASVEVGTTTGANPFFTVPQEVVDKYELDDFAQKMVGRSVQITGATFTNKDWKENVSNNARAYLLRFPENGTLKNHQGALEYIAYGEKEGVHTGYKCRIRNSWYVVPSAWVSDAFCIRRNNRYPRLIENNTKAYTTDTMHRVTLKKEFSRKALVASFYNSLSFAFAEICGRSYGGGVLELMPNETEKILLPYSKDHSDLLHWIDKQLRNNKSIESILKKTNDIILKQTYGLTNKEIALANTIWEKLSSRRLRRGKKK